MATSKNSPATLALLEKERLSRLGSKYRYWINTETESIWKTREPGDIGEEDIEEVKGLARDFVTVRTNALLVLQVAESWKDISLPIRSMTMKLGDIVENVAAEVASRDLLESLIEYKRLEPYGGYRDEDDPDDPPDEDYRPSR